MLAVAGKYENGHVILDKEIVSENPVRVIVTFLDEVKPSTETRLGLSDFSFAKSRKLTEEYKGSFSDTLIEERRSEL